MGFEPVELSEGMAIFAVRPAEYHYNPIGVVHGGFALTLLDSAMGCAVHTDARGAGLLVARGKTNFVRPITRETGCVLAEGRVLHPRLQGWRTAEGRVVCAGHRQAARPRHDDVPDHARLRRSGRLWLARAAETAWSISVLSV